MLLKNILFKAFILFIPVLLFLGYVEFKLSLIKNTYSQKKYLLEKQHDKIKVLVLGSSHELYGIDPKYFSQKGFNLANVSQTLYYDELLTLAALPTLPNLKLVIQPVSYFSFYSQLSMASDEWREYFYYRCWGIKAGRVTSANINSFSYIYLYKPDVAQDILLYNKSMIPDLSAEGYQRVGIHQSQYLNDSVGRQRAIAHNEIIVDSTYNGIIQNMEHFIEELHRKNIEIVFITSPVYSTYSKYCSEKILDQNAKTMKYLCNKYNCKYYNYFTDGRFSINDFHDNDHLDFDGAEKFSKILDTDIIQPYFKKSL